MRGCALSLLRDVLVQPDRLDQLVPDRVHRVQRGHRVLEDHRDVVAADLAHSATSTPSVSRFSPPKIASPLEVAFRLLLRPMIVRQVTLLPQPDSPTMPSVFPFSTEKLTPSTAFTTPSSVAKVCSQIANVE